MRRLWSALIVASTGPIFLAATAGTAHAATNNLYVGGANCSDTGTGSQTQPFCTIIAAGTVAGAGQTVLVSSGTYSGPVVVQKSGTAGAPVAFQPAPSASVTIQGGQYGFSLSSRSYVNISGFAITGTVKNGIYVNKSDHITIANNTVTLSGTPASGKIAAGIGLYGSTASSVTGNIADRNSDSGIYLTSGTTGTTVSYNEASLNANVYQRNANGINVVSPGNTIIGNVLHDNEDSGLQFYPGGNNNFATLNVSYNNGDHGIDDLNVTGGRLVGNTIYHNCTSGINVEGTSGNYVVENNIAVDNAVYPAYKGISCSRRAGNIGIWDSAPASTTVDSNLVYLTKAGTMYVFGSSYSSLAAMRTATGQEQHGLQADPRFADTASANLQLTAGSPAIDSADSSAPNEQAADILGNARVDDQSVKDTGLGTRTFDDRGAYEFTGGGAVNSPPTARVSVSPASGTAPVAVTADGSTSTDPQGQALQYRFDFGDGTVVGPQAGATASHTYTAAGSYTVRLTVTDTSGLTGTSTATVSVTASTGGAVSYVNQIATNYSTSVHTSGYVTVWRTGGVTSGNLMVVTVALTGTTAGTVTATDDAADPFTVASDIVDGSGHRLLVLYGVARTGLAVNQKISVSFPSAATYRVMADEVSGATTLDRHVEASGSGTSYSSGATGTTSTAKEFVFSAVGLFAGSAPTWATGWKPLTNYTINTDYLGRAYQVASATGTFTGSGSGSGTWLAATVTFQ
ncbi:MAG TPA: PKD domain-containing protein [Jatrophihabitans sp.]